MPSKLWFHRNNVSSNNTIFINLKVCIGLFVSYHCTSVLFVNFNYHYEKYSFFVYSSEKNPLRMLPKNSQGISLVNLPRFFSGTQSCAFQRLFFMSYLSTFSVLFSITSFLNSLSSSGDSYGKLCLRL